MKLSLIRITRLANWLDREDSGKTKWIVLSWVESEMESGEIANASLGERRAAALNLIDFFRHHSALLSSSPYDEYSLDLFHRASDSTKSKPLICVLAPCPYI